jgi:hypothetical protein
MDVDLSTIDHRLHEDAVIASVDTSTLLVRRPDGMVDHLRASSTACSSLIWCGVPSKGPGKPGARTQRSGGAARAGRLAA